MLFEGRRSFLEAGGAKAGCRLVQCCCLGLGLRDGNLRGRAAHGLRGRLALSLFVGEWALEADFAPREVAEAALRTFPIFRTRLLMPLLAARRTQERLEECPSEVFLL